MRRRVRRGVLAALLASLAGVIIAPQASAANPAHVLGAGSSWVALAVQQWTAVAQTRGLSVDYQPSSSPQGLTEYAQGLLDFSATEAEYSALVGSNVGGPADARGYQYVPDVGGATAVMYHVKDRAGREVNYLHLSMRTIARIFMGDISNWDDPAITADNKGLVLPDEPITVVYRSGQSGTTGTFYDFVAHAAPDLFQAWAARFHLPTSVRIIQLDGTPNFAPHTIAFGGSDLVAQHIASGDGVGSIGYDEFGYALVYGAQTAWVKNASGNWVLPYPKNISAALESARLRPDLSQELSGVYASTNPLAYPISAYSYLVAQCARAADRPTCKGPYPNPGVTETLARWMRYIECEGQANLADGYSPLPPNLSQEISNSIGRMQGTAPETLTAANCANPRFHGSLGAVPEGPADPLANVPAIGSTSSGPGGSSIASNGNAGASSARRSGAQTNTTAGSSNQNQAAAGLAGAGQASAGGGSNSYRASAPVAYQHPGPGSPTSWPVWALACVLVVPPAVGSAFLRVRSRRARVRRTVRDTQ